MAQIHTLESDARDVGGALLVYPSGYRQQLAWRCAPETAAACDPRAAGQELATAALDGLLKRGGQADADRTNWASAAAALGVVYRGWGERGRARNEGGGLPLVGASQPDSHKPEI